MPQNVFVYGTLMADEVLLNLIARVPPKRPARVRGYRRYAIRGQCFPGTIHATDQDSVQGIVLESLTASEMRAFDAFEGEEYVQARAVAEHLDGSGTTDALLYIWLERQLLYGTWDYEQWRQEHLGDYAVMVADFAAELGHGDEPGAVEGS